MPIKQESRRRHLQRFLTLPNLSIPLVWFPLIKDMIEQNFPKNKPLYLALDRTQWKDKNLFMVAVIHQKRALPIYWQFLPKNGAMETKISRESGKRALVFTDQSLLRKGQKESVSRLRKVHQVMTKNSKFLLGLYGKVWIISHSLIRDWVEELMRLNRHKLPFYQRGLRAMELIQQGP